MPVQPIPDGYHSVTPYIIVGDCRLLIDFMEKALDAEVRECLELPDGTIKHAEVVVGNSPIMMGQAQNTWPALPTMNYLYVKDADAAYKKALAAGAEAVQEPQNEFYGDRNGGVKDPSGNYWWFGTRIEDVSPDEMKRRFTKMIEEKSGG
ncbi:MAG: VOC family protein [Planctomycetota bacterium]|jgi:uncharacterized glyoxalase superfamily protein PhnB